MWKPYLELLQCQGSALRLTSYCAMSSIHNPSHNSHFLGCGFRVLAEENPLDLAWLDSKCRHRDTQTCHMHNVTTINVG